MSAAAQAAVFALIFQVLAAAFGCPPEFAAPRREQIFRGAGDQVAGGMVCTARGVKRLASTPFERDHRDGPFNVPHADCPLCLASLCCHSALAPPAEAALFVPGSTGVQFAVEPGRRPVSVDVLFLRNRGPPASLSA